MDIKDFLKDTMVQIATGVKEATTDNIMDYSHLKEIDRHSFFHWQRQSMNRLL